MSKTTKIIAGLGIVAGLGIAAMPAISYAANTSSVDGDAEVIVEVTPAISLQIDGNNDTTPYGGFFESDPTGVYTAPDAQHTSTNTSSSKVSMSSNQARLGNTNAYDADNNPAGGFLSTLKVNTNDTAGYTLAVKTAETATGHETDLADGAGHYIGAVAAAGNIVAGTEAWGIKNNVAAANNEDISNDKWYAIATTDQSVRIAPASTTGYAEDQSIVLYGVATAASTAIGTYQNTLTYTATTAN